MSPKDKLIEKAKTFGIDTEGLTIDQLNAAIKKAKAEKIALLTVDVLDAKTAFDALLEDASDEDKATAQARIDSAEYDLAAFTGQTVEKKSEDVPGVFDLNGSLYAFRKSAPARFNFLGTNRTQEEWLQDEVAMELLIAGNSSFVKPIKK
jgi:hypothetical protein